MPRSFRAGVLVLAVALLTACSHPPGTMAAHPSALPLDRVGTEPTELHSPPIAVAIGPRRLPPRTTSSSLAVPSRRRGPGGPPSRGRRCGTGAGTRRCLCSPASARGRPRGARRGHQRRPLPRRRPLHDPAPRRPGRPVPASRRADPRRCRPPLAGDRRRRDGARRVPRWADRRAEGRAPRDHDDGRSRDRVPQCARSRDEELVGDRPAAGLRRARPQLLHHRPRPPSPTPPPPRRTGRRRRSGGPW